MSTLAPATATIDAGRLLTLERRREFAGLSLGLYADGTDRIIDCITRPESAGVLSERQIARALLSFDGWISTDRPGYFVGKIAEFVHRSMRNWANTGYPKSTDGLIAKLELRSIDVEAKLYHHL